MARNARSITARAVPWVALVLVAIFAFAQLHARREAERGESVVSDPESPPRDEAAALADQLTTEYRLNWRERRGAWNQKGILVLLFRLVY